VQVRERVAVFVPVEAGFPRKVTVQFPTRAARSLVPQLSSVTKKSVVFDRTGAPQVVAAAPPVFESVKTWVPEFAPTFTFPKSKVSGFQASEGWTPVTVMRLVVVETTPPTMQVRERVVEYKPSAPGFARMLAVQLAPAPRLFVLHV
jgi:hypothetical protein